jgi:hypothetical protein
MEANRKVRAMRPDVRLATNLVGGARTRQSFGERVLLAPSALVLKIDLESAQ